jgi:hypothetical protein
MKVGRLVGAIRLGRRVLSFFILIVMFISRNRTAARRFLGCLNIRANISILILIPTSFSRKVQMSVEPAFTHCTVVRSGRGVFVSETS